MEKTQKILLPLIILLGGFLRAQSLDFIFYDNLKNITNPAAAGEEEGHTVILNLNSQWMQSFISDAPQVQTINTTHQITDRIVLGGSVVSDKVFLQRQTAFFADFAYSLPISNTSILYLGLKAGGNLYNLDGTRFKTYNQDYDPYLQGISGKFQPNGGVGVFYKNSQFYIGLSVPNLLVSEKTKHTGERVTMVSEKLFLYSTAGYHFSFTKDITFRPSYLFFISEENQYQLSVTTAFIYRNFLEIGTAYRTTDAIKGYILLNIPTFYITIGYGFESAQQLKKYTKTHNIYEFMLKFKW